MSKKYKPSGIKIDGSMNKEDWNQGKTTDIHKAYVDEDAYEDSVWEVLKRIEANQVGLLSLKLIDANPRDLTIVPYTDMDVYKSESHHDRCNAFAKADNTADSVPDAEEWYPNSDGSPKDPERYKTSFGRGTGKGSDVHLHYTPKMFVGPGRTTAPCDTNAAYGGQDDEILIHELVHAYRDMNAHFTGKPTEDRLADYSNDEEFLAIVVTNVYMSGNKKDAYLRANHAGFKVLPESERTSEGFLNESDNLDLLVSFYPTEFILYQTLALIPPSVAKFNPFRELVRNGAKYEHEEIFPWFRPFTF